MWSPRSSGHAFVAGLSTPLGLPNGADGSTTVCGRTSPFRVRRADSKVCLSHKIGISGIGARTPFNQTIVPFCVRRRGGTALKPTASLLYAGMQRDSLPLCYIPSGCSFFTAPWTVTRSSLRVLRWVAALCRPLRCVPSGVISVLAEPSGWRTGVMLGGAGVVLRFSLPTPLRIWVASCLAAFPWA